MSTKVEDTENAATIDGLQYVCALNGKDTNSAGTLFVCERKFLSLFYPKGASPLPD